MSGSAVDPIVVSNLDIDPVDAVDALGRSGIAVDDLDRSGNAVDLVVVSNFDIDSVEPRLFVTSVPRSGSCSPSARPKGDGSPFLMSENSRSNFS